MTPRRRAQQGVAAEMRDQGHVHSAKRPNNESIFLNLDKTVFTFSEFLQIQKFLCPSQGCAAAVKDRDGCTPLYCAAAWNRLDAVRQLEALGAFFPEFLTLDLNPVDAVRQLEALGTFFSKFWP